MEFEMHQYTHALVGKVVPEAGCEYNIDYEEIRRQYDCYVRILKECNLEVIEVDLEGNFCERLMIENLGVVCNGIALLPMNETPSQVRNTKILKEILQKDLGQTVIDQVDPEALINCPDVLITGREFFIGMSQLTNEIGANIVAETFPEFPCAPVKVPRAAISLKTYVTVAGPDVLCVSSESKEAKKVVRRIEREADFSSYKTLTVPDDVAANCLYINGTLIHRAIEEVPNSFKVFCEKIDYARRSICFSEFTKMSVGLSTGCLLVRKI